MPEDKLISFIGEVLDKPTERMEQAGLNNEDIMAVRAVAIYEGLNENKALFERDDLEKAVSTFHKKPLRILFDGENPTGHGFDRTTGRFSPLVTNIGYIDWAYGYENEDTGRYEVVVEIAVWQKYYPEISLRMRQLHRDNDLKFSIEAERDYEITPEGYRRCYNINFRGLTVVQNPAFQEAKSLMVAEILKQGGLQMDELNKLIEEVKATIGTELAEQFNNHLGVLNTKITTLEGELTTEKETVATLRGEIATKDATITAIETERDGFKETVEKAEKEVLGTERLDKLAKYGEVKQTSEELAELSKEEFVNVLSEMVENFKPEMAGVDGVPYFKVSKEKVDRKAKLLALVEGFDA